MRGSLSTVALLLPLAGAAASQSLLDFSCGVSQPTFTGDDRYGAISILANTTSGRGTPFNSSVYVQSPGYLALNMSVVQYLPFTDLLVDVMVEETGDRLVVGRNVTLDNSTAFPFSLAKLRPRRQPYTLVCYAASIDGQQTWNATTSFTIGLGELKRSEPVSPARPAALMARQDAGPVDVWCGKPYRAGSPALPVGGQFPVPGKSAVPLLNFRCEPRIAPYLQGETTGGILVSTAVNDEVGVPFNDQESAVTMTVTVKGESGDLLSASIPFNATQDVPFSLSSLVPQLTPFEVNCTAATSNGTILTSTASELWFLPPNPHGGSTTKMDRLTGALLVNGTGTNGTYHTLFGTGAYTGWDWWLARDVYGVVDHAHAAGFSIIHPIGISGNDTAMKMLFDRTEELGMYVVPGLDYNWRLSATGNLSYIDDQVKKWQNRSSLLFWYTADEPDGQGMAFNASTLTLSAIRQQDSFYHPVGSVLNCKDYYWSEYSAGADIIGEDVYTVAVNTSYSTQYDTVCDDTYGCCGCDSCEGKTEDIAERLDTFADRVRWSGSTKMIMATPQTFGGETFWTRNPSYAETSIQFAVSVIHGAKLIESWDMPQPPAITEAGGTLASRFTQQKDYIFGSKIQASSNASRVDVGAWTTDLPLTNVNSTSTTVMLLVANLNVLPKTTYITLDSKLNLTSARDVYGDLAGGTLELADARTVKVKIQGLGTAWIELQK